MELTKDAIVQRVQDWYNADRLVGAVNIDLKRKHHVQGMPRLDWFAETLRSTADAEAVRKLQLIWEQLCFAPELWTHDGKMDVRILAGWSPFVLQDMFGIKSVYVQRKTEGAILDRSHHGIKLIPLLIYLNMCSTIKSAPRVAKQTLPFDHASDATLFVHVRNHIAGAAFGFVGTDRMCEPHFHTQLDYTPRAAAYQRTCRGLWTEMDRILQGDGTMQSAMQLANRSKSRGLVAATIYWMLCDPRNTAQDVREMVGRFITMVRGEVAPWCAPFDMSNVQIPSRPVLATTDGGLVKQEATLLSPLHAYNKGQVQFSVGQTETAAERGFREALHRLVDASADPDPKVFAYVLLTEFGERLRLSNKVPHFTGAVERDTLAHVGSSGRHSILWASTGDFIYRSVPSLGRELIDWQHPDNVAHLQACYNAHNTPLGDTHPCSHFTSRPH